MPAAQSPEKKMVEIDTASASQKDLYRLISGAVVPRPIAFVSTQNAMGEVNLAPFSFFNGVSSKPPALMFAVSKKSDGSNKDTLINIRDTREFVVNIVSRWLVNAMNQTSANYPYGVSEMKAVGLTPAPSIKIKPPRVEESAVHFECRLFDTLEVGSGVGSSTIVVGEIVYAHVLDQLYKNGRILLDKLEPVARLAGFSYGRVDDVFDIPRPSIK